MQVLFALIAGLLFGLGLVVSQMINPMKVQNFLDVFGRWDPSLAFVMGGAILVAMPGFMIVLRRSRPLFAEGFGLPTRRDVDGRLMGGAALFGIGWGLSGYCPGPVLAALSLLAPGTLVFAAAMVAGMCLVRLVSASPPTATVSADTT